VLRMEEGGPQPNYAFCTPFFRGLESRHDIFADVFAYDSDILQVRGRTTNEEVSGMTVSGQFFRALQTPPLLGTISDPGRRSKRRQPVRACGGGHRAVLGDLV